MSGQKVKPHVKRERATWGQELKSRQAKVRSLIRIAQQIVELSFEHNLSINEFLAVLEIAKEYPFKHTLTFEAPIRAYDIKTALSISYSIELEREATDIEWRRNRAKRKPIRGTAEK